MSKVIATLALVVAAASAKADPTIDPQFQAIGYQALADGLVQQHKLPVGSMLLSISSKTSVLFDYVYEVQNVGPKCFKATGSVEFKDEGKATVKFQSIDPVAVACPN